MNDLLTILQHADSAFPSGSFAFSNGIEGLAAMNAPLDRSGLRDVVAMFLQHRSVTSDRVAVALADRAGDDFDKLAEFLERKSRPGPSVMRVRSTPPLRARHAALPKRAVPYAPAGDLDVDHFTAGVGRIRRQRRHCLMQRVLELALAHLRATLDATGLCTAVERLLGGAAIVPGA